MSASANADSAKPPFLAFANDSADIATLKNFAQVHQWAESSIYQGDIRTAAQFLKNQESPALLVVEIPSAAEAPALLDALADVCNPQTKVITIGAINEYSFYCWLMDIGIFSYLLKPLTSSMLESAYRKSLETPGAKALGDKPLAKVIAVMGARGGVGATTVSLNLAGIFAEKSAQPVALVDVDPQEGSIALTLDIDPSRGLREALERPDRIDALFTQRVMTKPIKNLSVLSAEESLAESLHIHAQSADLLVKELRDKFSITVLDIPRHLNAFSKQCLASADETLFVTDLTLLSLRDVLRLADFTRDSLKKKTPLIVANRVGFAPKQEMPVDDFEKGINGKIIQRVPFSPDLFMHIGNTIPALTHKAHVAVKPLYQLAGHLAPEIKAKSGPQAKRPFSLFKKKES